jgi:hypothetical protein
MTYSDVWTGAESPERFAEEFSSRAEVEWPTWITLAPNDRVTFDGQDGWVIRHDLCNYPGGPCTLDS